LLADIHTTLDASRSITISWENQKKYSLGNKKNLDAPHAILKVLILKMTAKMLNLKHLLRKLKMTK